jgi:hypothetical protein
MRSIVSVLAKLAGDRGAASMSEFLSGKILLAPLHTDTLNGVFNEMDHGDQI